MLARQPPIYNRPVWGKVPGRGQPAGTATPPPDLGRDAFGDGDGVPSLAEPSCSEPRGHDPGRGQRGSGSWRVKSRWVGLGPPWVPILHPQGGSPTPEAQISLRADATMSLPLTLTPALL